tara:strand:- start:4782 stop:5039 length:258 start_codon:yes stop_codon:yes gene_type:complete
MNHFANVLRNVELASLTHLYLERDQIGDNGMIAFADAIKPTDEIPMGALVSLKTLLVDGGPLGDEHPALNEACVARGITLFVIPG